MRTLIGVVLDRSGSMSSKLDDTIGGFNSFVEDQRAAGHDQVYIVAQFDNEYEVLQDGVELDDVMVLTKKNFVPRGSTALLDAMGRTIHALDAVLENDNTIDQVQMITLTDGKENASGEFDRDRVFKLIEEREKKGFWAFNFIGANQDSIAAGASIGIKAANCLNYADSADGMTRAFQATSRVVRSYCAGKGNDFTSEDELA